MEYIFVALMPFWSFAPSTRLMCNCFHNNHVFQRVWELCKKLIKLYQNHWLIGYKANNGVNGVRAQVHFRGSGIGFRRLEASVELSSEPLITCETNRFSHELWEYCRVEWANGLFPEVLSRGVPSAWNDASITVITA